MRFSFLTHPKEFLANQPTLPLTLFFIVCMSEPSQETTPEEEAGKAVRPSFVYLLHCTDGATYVGATMDVVHRLRQHNQELKGGAYATSAKVDRGEAWEMVVYVSGFPSWNAALQFEWRWKQLSRKLHSLSRTPLTRRLQALYHLTNKLDRATSKAVPYAEWPGGPPKLEWQSVAACAHYEQVAAARQLSS